MKTASSVSRVVARIVSAAGDVVFPASCLQCQGLVERAHGQEPDFKHVCTSCARQIEYAKPPCCTTCGHPFYGAVEGERMCPHCAGLSPAFAEGRTAVLFKGPARALVIELKYHKGLHVLRDMEAIFRRSEHLLDFVRDKVLVPVPLHPRKARERGYNQAQLLTETLARAAAGTTRVEPLLERVVDTVTQTAFDRRERAMNLKNAFALARGAAINPTSPYILVDDVFTTGSTLNSCAQTLRRAGALNLGVATFGHG